MQQLVTRFCSVAVVAVLATCSLGVYSAGGGDKEGTPKALSPDVVKAWRDAGADVGWMRDLPPKPTSGYEYWEPFRKKGEPEAVPAFKFHPKKKGELAKLPDPGVPFGLDLHCWSGTDADLKELVGLKSLQSLNIGGALLLKGPGLKELAGLKNLRGLYLFYSNVTDSGLKELAALKDLQALDISNTQVTDAGLKDLAALKNLQALNLRGTKVTGAGIAALKPDLVKCKITTGAD